MIGITFLLLYTSQLRAQNTDTTQLKSVGSTAVQDGIVYKKDSTGADSSRIILKKPAKYHSPKKAAAFSAIIPGAGQIYNKKWWKLPIIYAGTAGLVYSFQFNNSRYVKYLDAYKTRIDDDPSTTDGYSLYSDEQLETLFKYYHRNRDLTIIGGALLYVLNIVDAAVDAHLFTFNVSDDLSLNIHPTLINTAGYNRYRTGIGLSIRF